MLKSVDKRYNSALPKIVNNQKDKKINERFLTVENYFILVNFDPHQPVLYEDFLTGKVKATDPRPIVMGQYDIKTSL